ncbi:MAG: hypothetical protein ACR2QC_10765 [Gammaproteobacteria bacterium]
MKQSIRAVFALAAISSALLMSGCADKPGPRLREIERVSKMTDEEIEEARRACHLVATADYNCAELIAPSHGMSADEWQDLTAKTKVCRKNQQLSFNHCLRGKGVRYSEFN